ncbi:MAG: DUF4402 domain-containing protein [Bacteroidia bacterium]|nr:MAG: DUF4402 domain-containing protein [Bacteroidia bacterium]
MKTFKIIFAAVIIAGFATSAMAQNGNRQSAEAEAKAVVLAELTLEKTEDINWGQVARGDNPNLNPVTGEATNGAGINNSTTAIGRFILTGEGGASILVGWEKEDLTGPGDAIGFTPAVSYGTGDTDFGGSIITDGSTQAIDGDGTNYFWVGGTIDVAADQTAGEYQGEFTLTVEYN